jgi:hypothetical protein
MGNPSIAAIEDGLLVTINADATIKTWRRGEATTVGSQDLDADGRLIAPHGSVRVLLDNTVLRAQDTITRRTYGWRLGFRIFVTASNARGAAEERKGFGQKAGAYQMLDDLKNLLGGARIAVAGVSSKPQVELLGEKLEQFSSEGTVMALSVAVGTGYQAGG